MNPVNFRTLDGVSIVTIANSPVNALSAPVRQGLLAAMTAAGADPSVRAIVIAAEGKAFVAGADIAEFGKPPVPPTLPQVLAAIEGSHKPVVAAINGVALGGGLELALACHARIVGPAARLGLPEIKLGLIPGAGGTQRLPRLVGATRGFAMMLSGEPVSATEAVSIGLADAQAEGDLLASARALALELVADGAAPRVSERMAMLTAEDRENFEKAAEVATARAADSPNVPALVEAVRTTFLMPFAEALAVERSHFEALLQDPRSRALRHLFFAERQSAQVPGLGREVVPRRIARAAVVGAGTMGGGIAMCFAQAGIPVTLIDLTPDALATGLSRIRANYETSVKRGSLSAAAMSERLALITGATGLDNAGEADVIVEAAFEDMGVKTDIFRMLDRVAKPGAILATNTSYLDVDTIAAVTARPQDVLGLHFFSPANIMRLLEVVRSAKTAPDVLATGVELGRRLNKLPVVVGVCYGFVGNRMLAKRTLAAERLLLTGALPHEVDAAVTDFGFRMGPFAMADLAGLDIGWRARKASGAKAPVADALAEQGRFGQKTGRGFYLYPQGTRFGERDPETEELIISLSQAHGISRRGLTPDEIRARLLYPMVNEGARILEEGIASRPGDIDALWVAGYNWPRVTGGPMHWAETVGLARIAAALERQADEANDESLKPAALLSRLADIGASFTSKSAA